MFQQLTASDGHKFNCWMTKAEGPPKGGLVILQEIFGVTDQLKNVAARYAKLGYDVAIPALFDREQRDAVVPFDQAPVARELMLSMQLEKTMLDIEAAVETLRDGGHKVGVMGFCWGGGLAFRAAQTLNIAGAISFYGTQLPKYMDAPLKAPVLGLFGETDDHTPPEVVAKVEAYFDDVDIHMYAAGHAFANEMRPQIYDQTAAEDAHAKSAAFLDRVTQA